jgi:hypothetical protein
MKKLLMVAAGLLLFASPLVVFAQTVIPVGGTTVIPVGGQTVTNTAVPASSNTVQNPLGNINSFCGLIKAILGAAVAIGIPIAVLFIVYAGFKFVLARGNSEALVSARQNFLYTVIGIGIFLGAWLLAMVIANTVNTVSQGTTGQQAISCQ